MNIVIIGGGMAGLTSAIKLKLDNLDHQILIIEKKYPESNTQISGQRYRARESGKGVDPQNEIFQLLATRNNGKQTQQMETFGRLATQELHFWRNLATNGIDEDDKTLPMEITDKKEWFGPQWGNPNQAGKGRGKSVLMWLRHQAEAQGIQFLQGEAYDMVVEDEEIKKILVEDQNRKERRAFSVEADHFVLAGGSIGGNMFHSTNRSIKKSAQELAYKAGIPLIDSSLQMLHPFGNSSPDGRTKIGCLETDDLAGGAVYYKNGRRDTYVTDLLAEHQTHYHFPEITRRFQQQGSTVRVVLPGGIEKYAGVAHHYSHIGIDTSNGVRVRGLSNLSAIGDASNMGYWTEHNTRYPGFALTKCLVDAELLTNDMRQKRSAEKRIINITEIGIRPAAKDEGQVIQEIRNINTKALLDIELSDDPLVAHRSSEMWAHRLGKIPAETNQVLRDISIQTAEMYRRKTVGIKEPHIVSRTTAEGILPKYLSKER